MGRPLAVRLNPDGTFRAGSGDVLPPGQWLAGTLLSDEQQQRQEVYRTFLKRSEVGRPREQRNLLLAWARPIDMHFRLANEPRHTGTALLIMPLRLERPDSGTRVTVPGPFLSYRRIKDGVSIGLTPGSNLAVDSDLRFQIPAELLPFKVERARVLLRIEAPSRRVTLSVPSKDKPVEVHGVDNPLDPIRVDLADEKLLGLDAEGGLSVRLAVSEPLKGGQEEKWTLHYIEVEVTGQTLPVR
jgi:hypothetical protein